MTSLEAFYFGPLAWWGAGRRDFGMQFLSCDARMMITPLWGWGG